MNQESKEAELQQAQSIQATKHAELIAANNAAARKLLLSLSVSLYTTNEVSTIQRVPDVLIIS